MAYVRTVVSSDERVHGQVTHMFSTATIWAQQLKEQMWTVQKLRETFYPSLKGCSGELNPELAMFIAGFSLSTWGLNTWDELIRMCSGQKLHIYTTPVLIKLLMSRLGKLRTCFKNAEVGRIQECMIPLVHSEAFYLMRYSKRQATSHGQGQSPGSAMETEIMPRTKSPVFSPNRSHSPSRSPGPEQRSQDNVPCVGQKRKHMEDDDRAMSPPPQMRMKTWGPTSPQRTDGLNA